MAGKPLWRRTFDAVERPVGSQLERVVQTERFADVAGGVLRLRVALSRRVERESRKALHRVNLPAASDITRLREQLAGMERTIRRLEAQLEVQRSNRGATDAGNEQPARTSAARRPAQPAARPQRREVRSRNRPAAGGGDG